MYIAMYCCCCCFCCSYCIMLLLFICNCGCIMRDKKQQHETVTTTQSSLHCEEIQHRAVYINWSVFKSSYYEEKQYRFLSHSDMQADIPPNIIQCSDKV